ncbi:MAG: hypothetical protein AAFV72_26960 [Cyanobacteria bacterium J06635_1]
MGSITFEQVNKQYENGFVAVKDLNLTIDDKAIFVLFVDLFEGDTGHGW